KIAVYLLGRLPSDGVPFWDFDDPAAPAALRDASAAAIMASAFAELCTITPDRSLARRCRRMAETIVRTLASPAYLAPDGSPFLLMHSVGNLPSGSEIDVSLSYADYYFLEALGRLDQLLQ
ncbi:MAG: glucuronyl hydrolase, partial [Bacteroidales bacterium]|nr:glucuronyl hydrolase [Bacteroidales bacterium]